jgi:sensor c-di-GMP phosphodiesterase-like protein
MTSVSVVNTTAETIAGSTFLVRWRQAAAQIIVEPLDFIARLAALVN